MRVTLDDAIKKALDYYNSITSDNVINTSVKYIIVTARNVIEVDRIPDQRHGYLFEVKTTSEKTSIKYIS